MAGRTRTTTSKALREVLDALPGAVIAFKIGKNGDTPIFVNQELISKMEAGSGSELLSVARGSIASFVHPDDRSRIEKACAEVRKGGGSASFDCRIITAKGNLRLARVFCRAQASPDCGRLCVSFWLDLGCLSCPGRVALHEDRLRMPCRGRKRPGHVQRRDRHRPAERGRQRGHDHRARRPPHVRGKAARQGPDGGGFGRLRREGSGHPLMLKVNAAHGRLCKS